MLSASNAVARSEWTYDGAGRTTGENQSVSGTQLSALLSWKRDASGLATNTEMAVGQGAVVVSRSFDSAGRLASQTVAPSGSAEPVTFAYGYCGWNGLVASVGRRGVDSRKRL
ncbi:MAG TPA: hypothetical protein PKM57_03910 [Kiritimatiellia bacterium]|nr:hypothetical protein [Kiritimatiellia bacterium]HPS09606.1 hypothetical protein [Kiritimatiellia bacterium]